ncbi:MAG: hypothetical protein ABIH21_01205 [Patescibacteria group bacterium]
MFMHFVYPKSQKAELISIGILMLLCFLITWYFQQKDTETLYTHFYYVPIVLACIWWQRRGIIVPVFLSFILLALHSLMRVDTPVFEDVVRGIIFICVGSLVAIISSSERQKTERILEDKLKLETSYLGLSIKNQKMDELQDLIEEQEKRIKALESKG